MLSRLLGTSLPGPSLLLLALAISLGILDSLLAAEAQFAVPQIQGLKIQVGETVPLPGVESAIVHRFEDGRLTIAGNKQGIWSSDGGRTWAPGVRGPDDKTTFNLGNGEVLSIYRTSVKDADDAFHLAQRRSLDNWRTVKEETALLDSPQAAVTGGDDGSHHDGLLMHHGILRLKNGDLMATMYGNFQGDKTLADGYPEAFNMLKVRTVVVFSSDQDKSWRGPVTVAYDKQLGRGTHPDSSVQTTTEVPAVTQEGFNEADLTRAPNGDILCVMRSGGRLGVRKAPIFPTPLYLSRSTDEGRSWTAPVPIADRGVNPNVLTLANGVMVCAYARPGGGLIFSTDEAGETWTGAFQFCASDSYCNVVETEPNKILVIFYRGGETAFAGTFLTIERQ